MSKFNVQRHSLTSYVPHYWLPPIQKSKWCGFSFRLKISYDNGQGLYVICKLQNIATTFMYAATSLCSKDPRNIVFFIFCGLSLGNTWAFWVKLPQSHVITDELCMAHYKNANRILVFKSDGLLTLHFRCFYFCDLSSVTHIFQDQVWAWCLSRYTGILILSETDLLLLFPRLRYRTLQYI